MAHALRPLLWCALVACGSSSSSQPPPAQPAAPSGPSEADLAARRAHDEQVARDRAIAAHRVAEAEAQDALAVTCSEPKPWTQHERCLPSCYPTEEGDPRAAKKLAGAVAIEHVVCRAAGDDVATFVLADEVERGKLAARPFAKRFPAGHKKGTWQADVEAAFRDALPKLPRGDAVVVEGASRDVVDPLRHDPLKCATLVHYTHLHGALDACGMLGHAVCEASGNGAARAINVVHYRLAEAHRLQAAGKLDDCQQAALEAVAVARGLPRWRQYEKLNIAHWPEHVVYVTRFDGVLDEDALFAAAASLGEAAQQVYAGCGGAPNAPTKIEQEQSFHACW